MTQEALLRRDAFVRDATPVAGVVLDREFKPGLRRFEIHPRVYAIMLGSLAAFFATYVAAFADGEGMPLVLAVCGICFAAYFGLAGALDALSGDETKDESFAAFMHHGMDTGSGHMSGGAVLWQVVTLPLLLAGFGLFVLVYKAFL